MIANTFQPSAEAYSLRNRTTGKVFRLSRELVRSKRRRRTCRAARYFSRIREPRTFWVLSAFRKLGISLSINSKYEDSAGVFCGAL